MYISSSYYKMSIHDILYYLIIFFYYYFFFNYYFFFCYYFFCYYYLFILLLLILLLLLLLLFLFIIIINIIIIIIIITIIITFHLFLYLNIAETCILKCAEGGSLDNSSCSCDCSGQWEGVKCGMSRGVISDVHKKEE